MPRIVLTSPRPCDKDWMEDRLKSYFKNGVVILLTRSDRNQIIDNLIRELEQDPRVRITDFRRREFDDFLGRKYKEMEKEHEARFCSTPTPAFS